MDRFSRFSRFSCFSRVGRGSRGSRGSLIDGSRWDSRGSTTAEFATALPAVVLILVCCLGAVQVVGVQVRLTDAAASAARALARGEGVARAAGLVSGAVSGASLDTERRGEFVCAHAAASALPGVFAGLELRAKSCALAGGR